MLQSIDLIQTYVRANRHRRCLQTHIYLKNNQIQIHKKYL